MQLTQIPKPLQAKFGEFHEVQILNLSNNLISEIDDAFCKGLVNLVSLDV